MVGNLAGIALGVVIASIFRVSEGAKTGITIAVTMFFSVFSGMMGVTLKYVIDKKDTRCYKSEFVKQDITYSCPSGYTLNGNKCEK